jgi:FtsZ-interacting cell division protein ZipA
MQIERIYWLIGLAIILLVAAVASCIVQRLRQQKSRYATYGARYYRDKEFALEDPVLDAVGPTRITHHQDNSPSAVSHPTTLKPQMHLALPSSICIYVRSKNHEKFFSYDLLQAILNQGFVHGAMSFFHFAPQGTTLISLSHINPPGTFNLDQMGAFSTSGLCLFIQPHRLAKPLDVFDLMIEKSKYLAEELGGVVEDENHHLLTPERLNDWRAKLVD